MRRSFPGRLWDAWYARLLIGCVATGPSFAAGGLLVIVPQDLGGTGHEYSTVFLLVLPLVAAAVVAYGLGGAGFLGCLIGILLGWFVAMSSHEAIAHALGAGPSDVLQSSSLGWIGLGFSMCALTVAGIGLLAWPLGFFVRSARRPNGGTRDQG